MHAHRSPKFTITWMPCYFVRGDHKAGRGPLGRPYSREEVPLQNLKFAAGQKLLGCLESQRQGETPVSASCRPCTAPPPGRPHSREKVPLQMVLMSNVPNSHEMVRGTAKWQPWDHAKLNEPMKRSYRINARANGTIERTHNVQVLAVWAQAHTEHKAHHATRRRPQTVDSEHNAQQECPANWDRAQRTTHNEAQAHG